VKFELSIINFKIILKLNVIKVKFYN